MREHKSIIFLCVASSLYFLICPLSYLRYHYETYKIDSPEFFMDIFIRAENEKNNDYEIFENYSGKKIINIPSKYKKYKFYLQGRILNGIKDVSVHVNKKPVKDAHLSFPQGMHYFFDTIYLEKIFGCNVNLRTGHNIIIIKSGNSEEKIIVNLGSD